MHSNQTGDRKIANSSFAAKLYSAFSCSAIHGSVPRFRDPFRKLKDANHLKTECRSTTSNIGTISLLFRVSNRSTCYGFFLACEESRVHKVMVSAFKLIVFHKISTWTRAHTPWAYEARQSHRAPSNLTRRKMQQKLFCARIHHVLTVQVTAIRRKEVYSQLMVEDWNAIKGNEDKIRIIRTQNFALSSCAAQTWLNETSVEGGRKQLQLIHLPESSRSRTRILIEWY